MEPITATQRFVLEFLAKSPIRWILGSRTPQGITLDDGQLLFLTDDQIKALIWLYTKNLLQVIIEKSDPSGRVDVVFKLDWWGAVAFRRHYPEFDRVEGEGFDPSSDDETNQITHQLNLTGDLGQTLKFQPLALGPNGWMR
jgi:hypothetical protein